ncbi:MAG TPA: hypothetical protein VFU19_04130 [Iamia sp.]|nr:hypothetical protein [Iamia sp.]
MDVALDRFRRLVLDDPDRHAALWAEGDPRRFAVEVVVRAHVAGIDVDLATVQAALSAARARRLTPGAGAGPLAADPPRARWDDVADWTPWVISPGVDGPVVEWVHTAGRSFSDPFFHQTIEAARRHPARLLLDARTALADLPADAGRAPALPVAGLVLHMSRCGSTLVAQVLDALPRLLVLSEPEPVDAVLRLARAAHPLPDGTPVGPAHVRAVVTALARARHPDHEACVLKLDAWAVADLPLLRAALPGVPWVFVHRRGAAVLASHRRVRGIHLWPDGLPGPWPGWAPDLPAGLGADERDARTLAALVRAAADHAGPDGRVVDHADLPGAVAEVVAPHLGLALDAGDRAAMAAAGRRDAKNPVQDHVPPAEAPADLARAAERWIEPERARLVEVMG